MSVSAAEQARVFAIMLLLGAGLGVLRCAASLLLRGARAGSVMEEIADLAFGVICAAGITAAALALRIQAVRLYVFAGVLGGMAAAIGIWAAIGCCCRRIFSFWRRRRAKKRKSFSNA